MREIETRSISGSGTKTLLSGAPDIRFIYAIAQVRRPADGVSGGHAIRYAFNGRWPAGSWRVYFLNQCFHNTGRNGCRLLPVPREKVYAVLQQFDYRR